MSSVIVSVAGRAEGGLAAIAVVVQNATDGNTIRSVAELIGSTSQPEADYRALLRALEALLASPKTFTRLLLRLESQPLIDHVLGSGPGDDALVGMRARAQFILSALKLKGSTIEVAQVPYDENEAFQQCTQLLDRLT